MRFNPCRPNVNFSTSYQNGADLPAAILPCFALILLFLLPGCNPALEISELIRIREKGKLTVLTRNAPTTFYEGSNRRMGFEHDLVMAFARHLQVTPEFVVLDTTAEVYDALRQGKGDMAASGLFRTETGGQEFRYGPVYDEVQELVVCRRGNKPPGGIFQLNQIRFQVPGGSAHEVRLNELQQQFPDLTWESRANITTEQVLEKVDNNELDCTIADSNIIRINQRYYPELDASFSIGEARKLSWVLPGQSTQLQQELNIWFKSIQENGALEEIRDRYYGLGDAEAFDYVDVRKFHKRMESRLPYFINLFKKAEKRYQLPWQVLAAISYQESHWNPWARSPTGVRGVMMLTSLTAQELRITNRLDPRESILGAAWYLVELMRRLPAEMGEMDRLWLALAAYNVGMGHVLDARELAKRLDRNPNTWVELREVLPLLSNPDYYETLKYGHARGHEAVNFVNKVRLFYDILEKKEWDYEAKNNAELFRRAARGLPAPNATWEDWQDVAGTLLLPPPRPTVGIKLPVVGKAAAGDVPPVGEFGLNEWEEETNQDDMGSGDEQPRRPPANSRPLPLR